MMMKGIEEEEEEERSKLWGVYVQDTMRKLEGLTVVDITTFYCMYV